MTILDSVRKRVSNGDEDPNVAATTATDDGQLPIPGYDRIKDKDLIAELQKHSQAELTAIETYEHSHKKRLAVFDKLRYLRGQEPFSNYDALSVEEVLAGIQDADTKTLSRTRVYERKFQRRPDVLEAVATAISARRPASGRRG
jgi:hypothetical protein